MKPKLHRGTYDQIKVGTYDLGREYVDLIALPQETGGYYYFQPEEGRVGRLKIGIDWHNWWEVVSILLHEVTEYALHKQNLAYAKCGATSYASDCRWFMFNHQEFSETTANVAYFLTKALPDLAKVWNAHAKKKGYLKKR